MDCNADFGKPTEDIPIKVEIRSYSDSTTQSTAKTSKQGKVDSILPYTNI